MSLFFTSKFQTIDLSFYEAEFLAKWIDASMKEFLKMKANIEDYITAQAFLGNSFPEELTTEDLVSQIDDQMNGLLVIRERIKATFGI